MCFFQYQYRSQQPNLFILIPNLHVKNFQNPYSNSVGHKGKFGHEFLEFEFRPDGRLRYANNSHYKNETMIRKEGEVSFCV